jgi:type II secretory pathway pseudopilin PulG
MEGTVGAPPQRVCPHCARISWATGPHCPYCTARFSRAPGVTPWMLVAAAAVVLIGVALMLLFAGHQLDNKLNDRVDEVNQRIDTEFDQVRSDVRKELDARGAGAAIPTATPFPTTTPTPFPTGTPTTAPTSTPTSSPSGKPTSTPSASETVPGGP